MERHRLRTRRVLTEADQRAWARFVQHVEPIPDAASPRAKSEDHPDPSTPPVPPVARIAGRSLAPLEVGAAPGGVDRSTWTRFRTGKLAPERVLDLHGRTVQRAHAELHAFFGRAVAERLRCVEVITGRGSQGSGSGESGGLIRRELPLWLNGPALRPMVLAAVHPHPANPGSVRLLLRRSARDERGSAPVRVRLAGNRSR